MILTNFYEVNLKSQENRNRGLCRWAKYKESLEYFSSYQDTVEHSYATNCQCYTDFLFFLQRVSIECQKQFPNCFGLALLRFLIDSKNFAPLSQPIRSKTKSKHDLLDTRFPTLGAGYRYSLRGLIGSLE